jgi:hypothetical protein
VTRRRRVRRNAYVRNASRRRIRRRRSPRRNYSRNQATKMILNTMKAGAAITVGVIAHKLLSGLVRDQVIARLRPAPAPAAAGLGQISKYSGLIASGLTMVGGVLLTNAVIKDQKTKALISGGMAASFVHGLAITLLEVAKQDRAAAMLAGNDSTAVRLSAMGASIMPRYAPIGEYFQASPQLGEYFTNNQLGAYSGNPDIYQAAAGMGAEENAYGHSNHILPNSDLDRELSLAEAAAGVGQVKPYEAAAGMGEYFQSGMGAVETVPSESTWIPGTSDPQLWAGVKAVNRGQQATEMLPAGVLETAGGQGIFG